MSTATTRIDTTKVAGRRELHFDSLEDILAEVDRLAGSREIKTLGNWSAGQIFEHLARVMDRSIDGFENTLPAIVRFVFQYTLKPRLLNKPMTAGFKLPAKAGAELIAPPTSFEDGLAHIRGAIHRLQTDPKRVPSPFLGPLTRDEWTRMHCRHAELHLSFLIPE
jgi:uncharacterized protein DUF1569